MMSSSPSIVVNGEDMDVDEEINNDVNAGV